MLSLSNIQSQLAGLEAAGVANADPDAWAKMLDSYNELLAEIKASSDPNSPGGAKWTVSEIVGILPEFADMTTKILALVMEFLTPTSASPSPDPVA